MASIAIGSHYGRKLALVAAALLETVGAVDGLVAARLEWHARHAAALRARRLEHLARRAGVPAAVVAVVSHPTAAAPGVAPAAVGRPALRAAAGLVGEALL